MRRSENAPRVLVLFVVALAVLGAAGCGAAKHDAYTSADTEGTYLRAGGLNYQVQLSRELNPALLEDSEALRGIPAGSSAPSPHEEYFGVWMRADNPTTHTLPLADDFTITDTQGHVYHPIALDATANILAYQPRALPGGGVYPPTNAVAAQSGPRQGGLLLFKLDFSAYQDRPVDLNILSRGTPSRVEASVKIDL